MSTPSVSPVTSRPYPSAAAGAGGAGSGASGTAQPPEPALCTCCCCGLSGGSLSKSLALMLRVLLGALFIYSGAAKLGLLNEVFDKHLGDPLEFARAVRAFGILHPDVIPFATFAFPWMELLCGACLVLGACTQAAASMIGLILLAFLGAMFKIIMTKEKVHCGCFGSAPDIFLFKYLLTTEVGWISVGRNVVLLAIVGFVAARGPGYFGLDRLCTRRVRR